MKKHFTLNLIILILSIVLVSIVSCTNNSNQPKPQSDTIINSFNVVVDLPEEFDCARIDDNFRVSNIIDSTHNKTIKLNYTNDNEVHTCKYDTNRNLFSVIYKHNGEEFALDYITPYQLDSLINHLNM